ncbi:MAG: YggS family pyridoxal phosphate-dependent enzyme [Casimicrobiaceae bacterium]
MSHYENAWQAVMQRIAIAARDAGRTAADVRLLAVSKTFPAGAVRAVHACGQRAFGENYVQETVAKKALLEDLPGIEWRLIGPLQSNKTALAAGLFDAVETIDDLRIARRLATARTAAATPLRVLVQVNISGEASKSGVRADEALPLAREVARLPGLALDGFMGIAAPDAGADVQRLQFCALRQCFERAIDEGLAVNTLSMGMSGDLELAIAEGATEVRVGSALFGARPPRDSLPAAGGDNNGEQSA